MDLIEEAEKYVREYIKEFHSPDNMIPGSNLKHLNSFSVWLLSTMQDELEELRREINNLPEIIETACDRAYSDGIHDGYRQGFHDCAEGRA